MKLKHNYSELPDNYHISEDGTITNLKTNRTLKGNQSSTGYLTVDFYPEGKHGKRQKMYLHRIIATRFIPAPENIPLEELDVNHKDGNKQHNAAQNLEWVSRSDNVKHAYATGLAHQQGCRVLAEDGEGNKLFFSSYRDAALHFGVARHCVQTRLAPSGKNIPLNGFSLQKIEE